MLAARRHKAKGAGTTPPRVLLALTHLSGEIKKASNPLSDRDRWLEEVTTALAELSPVVADAESARTERRLLTPEVESARQAWLQVYKASRCAVECVLRLTGKVDMLSIVFHDLAVPASTKVTEAPADAPAASPPVDRPFFTTAVEPSASEEFRNDTLDAALESALEGYSSSAFAVAAARIG